MRWPWQPKIEARSASGGYTEIIGRLIEAQAAGTTQQASSTAAVEAAAGALSRAFAAADVQGPPWVQEAVSARFLAQVGRDLIRVGESCHVIRYMNGRMILLPASTWYFEGGADPMDWLCTATVYGPSGSATWRLPMDSIVFVAWGSPTARPYHGLSPMTWAAETARLNANAERSLANEAGGPVAQLLTVPEGAGGDDDDDGDSLATLRASITGAKGKALLLESTAGGFGQGKAEAPRRDWVAARLGPDAPAGQVAVAKDAFARVLAACGASPAMWDDSDGTAKREALRQWHLGTVQPLARMLATELSAKLDAEIRLGFDLYNVDLAGRAQAFQKLVAGGIDPIKALQTAGLLAGEDA